jgi:fructokinase
LLAADTCFAVPAIQKQQNLSLQNGARRYSIVAIGEVLWDLFESSRRLGGAALNFAAHAKRLNNDALLISAVGSDSLGEEAVAAITELGLSTAFLQHTTRFQTGTARVHLGPGEETAFIIDRPAAYDSVDISGRELQQLASHAPAWLYYGTLFSSTPNGEATLGQLLNALPDATRFYDLNLRPACYSAPLVTRLLRTANVVKLNEDELHCVSQFTGLPSDIEAFCREGTNRYGWQAICITLGARGCAILAHGDYVEAQGHAVDVADPVGAGDAFAAAFVHGLVCRWPAGEIAAFANRVGALVASRRGAIPAWTVEEAIAL